MKLSVTTSMMCKTHGIEERYTIKEALTAFKTAGYEYVDMNLWQQSGHDMPLSFDNWREWVYETKEFAEKLGLGINQAHGQTRIGQYWDVADYPDNEFVDSMNYRCIEAASIFGAKWVVMHPSNLPHAPLYDREKLKADCIAYLSPYIEHAKKFGVGIAIENMVDFGGGKRRYCAGDITELIELCDYFNDKSVGICIDTGHANIGGADTAEAIKLVGSRLKCTHINDNIAKGDEHRFPFFGNMEWEPIVKALYEIGYEGDFAFEVGVFKMPRAAHPSWLRFTYEVGNVLLGLGK